MIVARASCSSIDIFEETRGDVSHRVCRAATCLAPDKKARGTTRWSDDSLSPRTYSPSSSLSRVSPSRSKVNNEFAAAVAHSRNPTAPLSKRLLEKSAEHRAVDRARYGDKMSRPHKCLRYIKLPRFRDNSVVALARVAQF